MNKEIYLPHEPLYNEKGSTIIHGAISPEMAHKVLVGLAEWAVKDPEQELSFYIDSQGGDYFASVMVAEAFRQSPNPIRTVALSRCWSGATLLVAAGDKGKRFAWPTADFLVHQLQIQEKYAGPINGLVQHALRAVELNRRFVRLLAELTGNSVSRVRKDAKKEIYLTALEAVEYGIIDEIIPRAKYRVRDATTQDE